MKIGKQKLWKAEATLKSSVFFRSIQPSNTSSLRNSVCIGKYKIGLVEARAKVKSPFLYIFQLTISALPGKKLNTKSTSNIIEVMKRNTEKNMVPVSSRKYWRMELILKGRQSTHWVTQEIAGEFVLSRLSSSHYLSSSYSTSNISLS